MSRAPKASAVPYIAHDFYFFVDFTFVDGVLPCCLTILFRVFVTFEICV
jgi:hypothetical protein